MECGTYGTDHIKMYVCKALAKIIAKWTSAYHWKALKKGTFIELSKRT